MFIKTDFNEMNLLINNMSDNCKKLSGLCDEAYEIAYKLKAMDSMRGILIQLNSEISGIEQTVRIMRQFREAMQTSMNKYGNYETNALRFLDEIQVVGNEQMPIENIIPKWMFEFFN